MTDYPLETLGPGEVVAEVLGKRHLPNGEDPIVISQVLRDALGLAGVRGTQRDLFMAVHDGPCDLAATAREFGCDSRVVKLDDADSYNALARLAAARERLRERLY